MEAANLQSGRLEKFFALLRRRRLDAALVTGEANVLSLTGVACDNACLVAAPGKGGGRAVLATDFRYVPMAHRVAPWLETVELKGGESFAKAAKRILSAMGAKKPQRLGYEQSVRAGTYLSFAGEFKGARLVDVEDDLLGLRAVKTVGEIMAISAAAAVNDEVWRNARAEISPGMTEREIRRVIRAWMNALSDGEAFETIVCAGANAAECHHVADDTVWRKGEPLLVDMGVKLDGVCSDMTRCIRPPAKKNPEYARAYETVLKANMAAIAAVKPGMKGSEVDAVAREIIGAAGYEGAFGHSLGHGVGYEIHEKPVAGPRSGDVLEAGMAVTIEPGIYLEGKFGIRIEDLVLVTKSGCEALSRSAKR